MSNPFSPQFAGSTVNAPSPSTTATAASPSNSNSNSDTMAPPSADFYAPSSNSNSDLATGIKNVAYATPPQDMASFSSQKPSGLSTTETTQAGGGATWTSPIEIKRRQQAAQQQQSGLVPSGPPPSMPAPPLPPQSTATGLSGFSSPLPLPMGMGTTSDTNINNMDDAMMGGPMGGATGAGCAINANPEEDDEYAQALRAAQEAEALMKNQTELKKKKQQEGFLGLKKLKPNFLRSDPDTTTNSGATDCGAANAKKSTGWFQSASPTRDSSTPPWHAKQQDAKHAATSDFGIPPPAPTPPATTVANTQNSNNNTPPSKGASVMGASVVGGVAGLMLMGPLVGVVAAGGVAYAAGTKEGPVGSILRGTGSLAATAGGAAKRFDNKHHVVGKTVNGLATGVGWVVKTVNGAS